MCLGPNGLDPCNVVCVLSLRVCYILWTIDGGWEPKLRVVAAVAGESQLRAAGGDGRTRSGQKREAREERFFLETMTTQASVAR